MKESKRDGEKEKRLQRKKNKFFNRLHFFSVNKSSINFCQIDSESSEFYLWVELCARSCQPLMIGEQGQVYWSVWATCGDSLTFTWILLPCIWHAYQKMKDNIKTSAASHVIYKWYMGLCGHARFFQTVKLMTPFKKKINPHFIALIVVVGST